MRGLVPASPPDVQCSQGACWLASAPRGPNALPRRRGHPHHRVPVRLCAGSHDPQGGAAGAQHTTDGLGRYVVTRVSQNGRTRLWYIVLPGGLVSALSRIDMAQSQRHSKKPSPSSIQSGCQLMKRIIFTPIVLLSVACSTPGKTLCMSNARGVCIVPTEAVYFAERQLAGRLIAFRAVVSVESETVYAYPNIEAKSYRFRERSILLSAEDGMLRKLRLLDGKYVTLVGTLSGDCADCWATFRLQVEPLEDPVPIENYPAAPPPPKDVIP